MPNNGEEMCAEAVETVAPPVGPSTESYGLRKAAAGFFAAPASIFLSMFGKIKRLLEHDPKDKHAKPAPQW